MAVSFLPLNQQPWMKHIENVILLSCPSLGQKFQTLSSDNSNTRDVVDVQMDDSMPVIPALKGSSIKGHRHLHSEFKDSLHDTLYKTNN